MTQTFKLTRAGEYGSVTPGCGEDLGAMLAGAASLREGDARCNPEAKVMYWGNTVAQVYFLAADAYEQGASASIGHNRSDRYETRARELRAKAESILTEAKEQRDATEAASMKAAFLAGREGGDASRYSFDSRAAFIVGEHFAALGLEMPAQVRAIRGDGDASTYIEADGCRYAVNYPGGRIPDATVTLVGGEG